MGEQRGLLSVVGTAFLGLVMGTASMGCDSEGVPTTLSIVPNESYSPPLVEAGVNTYSGPSASDDPYRSGTHVITSTGTPVAQFQLRVKNESPKRADWVGVTITVDDPAKIEWPLLQRFNDQVLTGALFIMDPPPMIDEGFPAYEEVRWPGKLFYANSLGPMEPGESRNWDGLIMALPNTHYHFEAIAAYPDGSYGISSPDVETSVIVNASDASARSVNLQRLRSTLLGSTALTTGVPRSSAQSAKTR